MNNTTKSAERSVGDTCKPVSSPFSYGQELTSDEFDTLFNEIRLKQTSNKDTDHTLNLYNSLVATSQQ